MPCWGPGKRLRPFLVIESAKLFAVPHARALEAGAALECLHCYSLAHDDLPAMDDDDLRRGRPTLHRAFDEATAILAGDALLTFAFEILSRPDIHPEPQVRLNLDRRACPRRWQGRHGRRPDARPRGRRRPQSWSGRGIDASGDENRRPLPLRLRGRRNSWPRRSGPARMLMAAPSALPSRLPTICSIFLLPPPPWERPRKRITRGERRPSSTYWVKRAPAIAPMNWWPRPMRRSNPMATGLTCYGPLPASSSGGKNDPILHPRTSIQIRCLSDRHKSA